MPGAFETPAGSKIALLNKHRSRNKFAVGGWYVQTFIV